MHNHFRDHGMNPKYALLASSWAVGTVIILIIAKTYAYAQSGSAAMLSTLADSIVDGGISLMMFFAVQLSLKPADDDHRYGHGKVEGLAALFQAAMMAGAAVFLIFESGQRFLEPRLLESHHLGVAVAALAIVLSAILIMVQNFCLKRAHSLAVEADKAHYTTDIFLNGTVIAALMMHYYGGPLWIDPLAALLVALYFARTAYKIGEKAVDMLMDKELPDDVRQQIKDTAFAHEQVKAIHDLRTRKIGMKIHISFDMELDPQLTLAAAHDVTMDVEVEILKDFPHAEVMIHMDPHGIPHDNSRHAAADIT